MLLLQFSTSHYCRKARLALGYKGISYQVENLTPGLHLLKLRPLTGGMSTVPVLLPQNPDYPQVVTDSTEILKFLDRYQPSPELYPLDPLLKQEVSLLEDWLDESIGTATRFVYYQYRAQEGKSIDPSPLSMMVIEIVRRQYGIHPTSVQLAKTRLKLALDVLQRRWENSPYLVGNRFSTADLTTVALCSPLALIPDYRENYPWLFDKICQIHQLCQEPFPPGITSI